MLGFLTGDLPWAGLDSLVSGAGLGRSQFPVDIYDTEKHYEFYCDLPGLSEKHVRIEVKTGQQAYLSISASRKQEGLKPDEVVVLRQDRPHGTFQRVFALPDDANVEKISASMDKGVLKVVVPKFTPKAEKVAVKSVPISKM